MTTETSYARARRAALFGLLVQAAAAAVVLVLALLSHAAALQTLAWFIVGGLPLWFVATLVFRQHELAALESLDLEELRREKQSVGGEALFGEGGGPGFLVAQARLDWMRRWLVPIFALASAAFLVSAGVYLCLQLAAFFGDPTLTLPELVRLDLSLIVLAVMMALLFFFSRYAAGLSRVSEWQLLRGCASFMLGNALAASAVFIVLGVHLYRGDVTWEHWVAWAIPVLMIVLGTETILNALLDIYRPRSPGVEPRAPFDSRILGLFSEPGGIAQSVADAINYQFGFQVSQTWFYRLVQRWCVPLIAAGAAVVWLLTGIVVVEPHERAIIERFGRQMNADAPLGPGIHVKWPAPFERTSKYNTGQLHEFAVGFDTGHTFAYAAQTQGESPIIELWSDEEHYGREHFNFVVPTPGASDRSGGSIALTDAGGRAPVHLIRMIVVVQYTVQPERLAAYTRYYDAGTGENGAHQALRDVAWEETLRFAATKTVDDLMGPQRDAFSRELQERVARRAETLDLGLDVRYVGLFSVHPEHSVAAAFRRVVTAQQEKVKAVRQAQVAENQILSEVAGDRASAVALATALSRVSESETLESEAGRSLDGRLPAGWRSDLAAAAADHEALFADWFAAQHALEQAEDARARLEEQLTFGFGQSVVQRDAAVAAVAAAEQEARAARAALETVLGPIERTLRGEYSEAAPALLEYLEARMELGFWNDRLEGLLPGLEGEAAVLLAEAHAERWKREMQAAGEVALLQGQRSAYEAAPELFAQRHYLRVLAEGLKNARKYFFAFEGPDVHLRIEAQEQARPDLSLSPTRVEE